MYTQLPGRLTLSPFPLQPFKGVKITSFILNLRDSTTPKMMFDDEKGIKREILLLRVKYILHLYQRYWSHNVMVIGANHPQTAIGVDQQRHYQWFPVHQAPWIPDKMAFVLQLPEILLVHMHLVI